MAHLITTVALKHVGKSLPGSGCMYASFPVAVNQLSFFVQVKDQTLVQHLRQSVAKPKFSHQLSSVT